MPMEPFEWSCKYCRRRQIATEQNVSVEFCHFDVGESKVGPLGISTRAIRCLNMGCNELNLEVQLHSAREVGLNQTYFAQGRSLLPAWQLLPESSAKPQPEYIPKAIREDYREACLIRDKSPKASATLARRCLQGMIRDFCKIVKATLDQEIKALRKLVDDGNAPKGVEHETIDAIDAVRKVGNIGAHMEKDVSTIIDVEPEEAQMLLELIEMLFDEWYIARDTRESRLKGLRALADAKAAQKALPPAAAPAQITDQTEAT